MSGIEAVLAAIATMESCGIPYILVGSFSTNAYGIPRSTQDADFVIELGEISITELAQRLAPSIRIDPHMRSGTVTRWYVADVTGTPFMIDFFLLNDDPHDQERFRRRRQTSLMGRPVWIPTAEDVIITKLHRALSGRWSKDRDDVRDVIAVQGDRIDWEHVHRWCERHGTRALLDEIRASIPPI